MSIPSPSGAPDPRPILSAADLRIAATGTLPSLTLNLTVLPGELHMILCRHGGRSGEIVDHLLGLAPADSGDVRFMDRDWHRMSSDEALGWRRNVGRVQHEGNWMETRPVMDSLLLPLRHHTLLPDHLLRKYASELAQRFGLPGIPTQLPQACAGADLERAACIRAFLGRPQLVVLEHPMAAADSDWLSPLINAIQQVRRRNGAVIWFTEHRDLLNDSSLPVDWRYQIVGGQLLELRTTP